MSVINTNYLALVSQNNLTKSQNSLGTAIERLSSGLRINSAKDDAAGQAIANRFTANINGLTQAARNANDGISVAQTTEGALNEINENLQRIRTLTVQATTGSNSDTDLKSIQAEIDQRLGEINRVAEQTQFNGVKVLASDQTLTVQVGAHDSETISINLQKIDSESLNLSKLGVTGMAKTVNTGDTIAVAGKTTTTEVDKAQSFVFLAEDGVTELKGSLVENDSAYYIKTDAGEYFVATAEEGTGDQAGVVTWTATNTAAAEPADTDLDDPKAPNDYDITPVEVTSTTEAGSAKVALDFSAEAVKGNSNSLIEMDGKHYVRSVNAQGDTAYYEAKQSEVVDGKVTFTVGDEVTTLDSVQASPLAAIDSALQQVDNLRSDLGAIQNRFQSTIANLNNTVNNLSAARSRIEDADYAVEVSNMTRAQILQQAGTSVLAQANQVPQTVLSLLR